MIKLTTAEMARTFGSDKAECDSVDMDTCMSYDRCGQCVTDRFTPAEIKAKFDVKHSVEYRAPFSRCDIV